MTAETTSDPSYLTDVAYLRTFSNNLAPPLLRAVAALNGFAPPPADGFDYCELGSGHGDTTATLAAAYPRARFVGVDVMPEHVAFAEGLARRGGLDNVRFLEKDFADLAGDALPAFDFITAHGVWTWVSPEKRQALLAFAEAKLKPGGLLYVSYNALPGWAAIEPLRRLMLDAAPGVTDTLERARRGLALARALSDADAAYFTSNPAVRTMLDTMTKSGLSYIAHEYFTPHWHPMHFGDVAREMAAHQLYYVGQLPLHLNYADLALPKPIAKLFEGVADRIVFESLKDYAVNEFFRREVYVKGAAARSEAATAAYLDHTLFGTTSGLGAVPREARLPCYTLRFTAPLFDALLPALATEPATIPELAARPALAAFGAQRVRESVLQLLLGDVVAPMQAAPRLSPAGADRYRASGAYNRMILAQELGHESTVVLASKIAGAGVVLSGLDAVSLRALTEVQPKERQAWLRAFAARPSLRLRAGDRAIDDPDEKARVLERGLAELRADKLPKLVQLGVVEPRR